MSYGEAPAGGTRAPHVAAPGSDRRNPKLTDTSGTAPTGGASVLQPTSNPKTIVLDCNRRTASRTIDGGNPENNKWTCQFPAIQLKAGDEVRVSSAYLSSIGVGDLIAWNREDGGLGQDNKATWVTEYYQTNDGKNGKREGYNMVNVHDTGTGGVGGGPARVWGGDGIWAYPTDNQSAPLYQNLSYIGYMIPPSSAVGATTNRLNPWCPPDFKPWNSYNGPGPVPPPAGYFGSGECSVRWYEDPNLAGRYLSKNVRFRSLMSYDLAGPPQTAVTPPAIQTNGQEPWCFRVFPHPFDAADREYRGNPVMLMQFGHATAGAIIDDIYPFNNATNPDPQVLVVPVGYSFYTNPAINSQLDAVPAGAFNERTPSQAKAKAVAATLGYKWTCVGHFDDTTGSLGAPNKRYTMVERPYYTKEWSLTYGAAVIGNTSAWGTAYIHIGEGGLVGATGTGSGAGREYDNARVATVSAIEGYDYNPDVLSTMYFGDSPDQLIKTGTGKEQASSPLTANAQTRCEANVTALPLPSPYVTQEITVKMVGLDERIGERTWIVVPENLAVGGDTTVCDLRLYLPTLRQEASVLTARPIMTENQLIVANGDSRNMTFIIRHLDGTSETMSCYLMAANVLANHNSGSNTVVPSTALQHATLRDPAPPAPLPAGQAYTTWRFTNVVRNVQDAEQLNAVNQQLAQTTWAANDGTFDGTSLWLAGGGDSYYDVEMPTYAPIDVPSTRPNFYYQNGSQKNGNTRGYYIEIGNHASNPNGRTTVTTESLPPATQNFNGSTWIDVIVKPTIQYASRTTAGAALQPMGLPIFTDGVSPSAPYAAVSFENIVPIEYTIPVRHYRRTSYQIDDDYSSPSDVATALTAQTHTLSDAQGEFGGKIPFSAGKACPQNNLVFPVYSSFAKSSEPTQNLITGVVPVGWNPSERGDGTISLAGEETHGSYKAKLKAHQLPANRFDPTATVFSTDGDYWLYFRSKYLSLNKPRIPQSDTVDGAPPRNVSYVTAYVRKGNFVNGLTGLSINQDFNICGQSYFPQIAGNPLSGPTPVGYAAAGNAIINPGGIARSACFDELDVGKASPATGDIVGNDQANGFPINYIDLSDDNAYIAQYIGAADITWGWDDASSRFTCGYIGEPSVDTFDISSGTGGTKAITIYNPSPSGRNNYQFLRSQTRVGGVNVANWYSSNPVFGNTPNETRTLYNVPDRFTLDAVADGAATDTPIEWFLFDEDAVSKRFWTKLGFDEDTQLSAGAPDATRISGSRIEAPTGQYIPLGSTELQLDSADSLVTSDEPPASTPYYSILSTANNPTGTGTPAAQLARWEYASRGALCMRNANYGYTFGSTAGLPLSFKTNVDPTAIAGGAAFDMASSSYNGDRSEFTAYTVAADTSLIRAKNLPIKQEDAYLYCLSNIVDGDFYTSNGAGAKQPIVGVLNKLNAAGDFLYSLGSNNSSFIRQDRLLTEVSIEIVTPDFRVPPGVDANSSVVFSITRQNDQPVEPAIPVWYKQQQMWSQMLQHFKLMADQIGGGPKLSAADRVQEIIREVADAVIAPDGNAALPEQIVANYQRLGLGDMGGAQMRQFLLEHPDGGDFLRNLATHANARIPDGTLATVTDPESVTPETLLNTALTLPIDAPPGFAQTPAQAQVAALQQHMTDVMEQMHAIPAAIDVDPHQAQAALVAAHMAAENAGPATNVGFFGAGLAAADDPLEQLQRPTQRDIAEGMRGGQTPELRDMAARVAAMTRRVPRTAAEQYASVDELLARGESAFPPPVPVLAQGGLESVDPGSGGSSAGSAASGPPSEGSFRGFENVGPGSGGSSEGSAANSQGFASAVALSSGSSSLPLFLGSSPSGSLSSAGSREAEPRIAEQARREFLPGGARFLNFYPSRLGIQPTQIAPYPEEERRVAETRAQLAESRREAAARDATRHEPTG